LERLGRFQADVIADTARPGISFGALAAAQALADDAAVRALVPASFSTPAREAGAAPGDSVLLGSLQLAGKLIYVLAGRDRFSAFDASGAPLWSKPVEPAIAPQAWMSGALLAPESCRGEQQEVACGGRVVLTWRRGMQQAARFGERHQMASVTAGQLQSVQVGEPG
jgi:hypothetical protein